MIIIGVTGGFGTGKTTVARMFETLGATVFDADKIAHGALLPRTAVYKRVVEIFGREILNRDKTINRKRLGGFVFKNPKMLKRLCAVIHPYVIKEIKSGIRRIKKAPGGAVVIVDAPLLVEAGLLDMVDRLVVVRTGRAAQIERCRSKAGLKPGEILARINAQLPITQKIRFSDFVIDNNGTIKQTKGKVKKVWEQIRR